MRLQAWSQAIWQSSAILFLGLVFALMINYLRSDGLSMVEDWAVEDRLTLDSGESLAVSLEESQEFFFSQTAIFLDARSPELYQEGHILGAYNFPMDAFDEYFSEVMVDIPSDATIIIYCDSEGCGLSEELALELLDKGYLNVRVLVNGWSLWKADQLPAKTGTSPGSLSSSP